MKKGLSLLLSGALVLSAAFIFPQSVSAAGSSTIEAFGTFSNSGADVLDDNGASTQLIGETDIDVSVRTSGGDQLVYSVGISWGDMKFVYDFGKTWDPTTHSYINGESGTVEGGWVVTGYVNEINNKISIQNHSNYPISAKFSYVPEEGSNGAGSTKFNVNALNTDSVAGVFMDDNEDLKDGLDLTSGIPSLSGYGVVQDHDNTPGNVSWTSPVVQLEMSWAGLQAGDKVYTLNNTGVTVGDTNTNWKKDMYFALCGKPDANVRLGSADPASFDTVGKIHIELKPVQGLNAQSVGAQTP